MRLFYYVFIFVTTMHQTHASRRYRLEPEARLRLSQKSDKDSFMTLLEPIMTVRWPDTPQHTQVRQHIQNYLVNLGWEVQHDQFQSNTPLGEKTFTNIVATQNLNAPRRLSLACHYDSKVYQDFDFLGMTDSAVPCAMLLDMARTLTPSIQQGQQYTQPDVSLQLIFFDGEEAFHQWSETDSIYGARHLADVMEATKSNIYREVYPNDLQRMDMLVLLDLIGAKNPSFKNWFSETSESFKHCQEIEQSLIRNRHLTNIRSTSGNRFFMGDLLPEQYRRGIEDDHIPFLRKGVPILHLISHPFPEVWHTRHDGWEAFDWTSTDNVQKVLRVFVAEYLRLNHIV